MSYTFHISLNGSDYVQVYPKEGIQATKEGVTGCIFHREKISEVSLLEANNETIYASLESYYIDDTKFNDQLEFEVYDGVRAGTAYFYGIFSISDCKQDHEKKIITFLPRVNDDYRILLEKADIDYDLVIDTNITQTLRLGYSEVLALGTTWTNGNYGHPYETLTATGGTITVATHAGAQECEAYINITTALSADDIVIIDVTAFTTTASTFTFDIITSAGVSVTSEGAKTAAVGLLAFTISADTANPEVAFVSNPDDGTTAATFTVRKIDELNDHVLAGANLMTFVEDFIDNTETMALTDYTGAVKSTFFNNDALPSDAPSTIDTWITAHSAGNYVTEVEASNELNNVVIGMLYRWFTDTGPSWKLSFNNIMAILRDMFQAYWYIDADGDFRIEHVKYFEKMVDDSTAITMASLIAYTPEADHLVTTFRKESIVSREQFEFAQALNEDFIGDDIIYDNFETSNNHGKYNVTNVTTDIKYVIDNISDASNSGFGIYHCQVLTNTDGADIYEIVISTGTLSSALISNAAMSWANLHAKYWTWKRMSENATVNGGAATLDSAIRFLEHEDLRFFYTTAIEWYNKITTSLGTGEIISAVRDFDTDYVELKIGYNPYE